MGGSPSPERPLKRPGVLISGPVTVGGSRAHPSTKSAKCAHSSCTCPLALPAKLKLFRVCHMHTRTCSDRHGVRESQADAKSMQLRSCALRAWASAASGNYCRHAVWVEQTESHVQNRPDKFWLSHCDAIAWAVGLIGCMLCSCTCLSSMPTACWSKIVPV